MKHKLLTTSILLAGLAAPLHSTTAAEGATSVSIDLPNIIILHYLKNVDLNFTSKDLSVAEKGVSYTGDFGSVSLDGNVQAGSLSGVAKIDKPVHVLIKNAYAVRGLSPSGSANVAGKITSEKAENDGSIIKLVKLNVSADKIALKGLALSKAVSGDVDFYLDLSDATKSGDHTGAHYTIYAEGI